MKREISYKDIEKAAEQVRKAADTWDAMEKAADTWDAMEKAADTWEGLGDDPDPGDDQGEELTTYNRLKNGEMRITKYLYVSILDEEGGAFVVLGVDDCIIDAEKRIEREKAKRGEPQPGEAYRIVEARQEVEKRTIRKVGAVRDRVPVFRLCVELTTEGWRLKKGIINKL